LTENMNCLFSQKNRMFQITITVLLGFLCLLALRYFQSNIFKIAFLYSIILFVMYLVILYKNSLNKYGIGIFSFLCVQLIATAPIPEQLGLITSTSYLLSYRYGVSSRGFVATIVDFLTSGNFISVHFVWHFILCSTIFLSFIISVYLGTVIQKTKDNTKIFLIFLSLLYLSCFTSPSAYYTQANFGRVEIFALLLMLFLIVIIDNHVFRWLIPLLALSVLAIHLILLFFYIPFVIIMLYYEISAKKEKNKQTISLLICTITVILAAFLLYILFHERTFVFEDTRSFFEYLRTKSDLNVSERYLHLTMYGELQDHLTGWKNRINYMYSGNISIIINLPLVFLFVFFWLKCFIRETEKIMKPFFLLPVLALLYQSLAFFMFFDFGRWMIMILNVQFMLVFYLVFVRNKTVLSLVETITQVLKQNGFIVILICFVMIFLGPVREMGPSERIMHIISGLSHFFGLIK